MMVYVCVCVFERQGCRQQWKSGGALGAIHGKSPSEAGLLALAIAIIESDFLLSNWFSQAGESGLMISLIFLVIFNTKKRVGYK